MTRGDAASGEAKGNSRDWLGSDQAGADTAIQSESPGGAGWAVVVPTREPIRVVEFGPARARPGGDQPCRGHLEDARPGRDEMGLEFWYRELGCARVELVDLSRVCGVVLGLASPGLCLWLDEEAGRRDPLPGVNARARRVLVAVWGQRGAPWVRGTGVFTGALDRHGRCQGLSELAAQALIGVITGDYPGI